MKNWQRYPEYKDSGVEWLGEIPKHWEVKRLKWLVSKVGSGKTPKGGAEIYSNFGIIFIRSQNVHFDELKLDDVVYIDDSIDSQMASTRVFPFDILLNITGASLGRCSIVPDGFPPANVNQHVCIIRPIPNLINSKFLNQVISSNAVQRQIFSVEDGVSREGLSFFQIRNLIITLPKDIEEQKAIAHFLDRETSKLDKLIAKKQRFIELLQEKRTALISHAVTKGLNPDIPMKDSGISWLGQIPKHWEVKRLRYIGFCQNGVSKGGDYFGSGYPFVNYTDVYSNLELPQTVNGLAQSTDSDRINYSVQAGDVFFTRTSETIEEIGIASTCLTTINDAIFSGFLIRFRPFANLLYQKFSKYYFRCQQHRFFFVKEMNIVTRASLSQELLKKIPVLLPPLSEQKAIADFLDQETAKIDTLIEKTKTSIEKLKEYRTALISAAVTGKIDIREEI